MNLNIGSSEAGGRYKQSEWINLGLVKHDKMEVQGDALFLPFKDCTFDVIHCIHVLEHVTRDKQLPMLKEIYRVLKYKKSAYIEVPNFEEVINNLYRAFSRKDKGSIHIWTTSVYGKNERHGMAHYWGFSEDLLYSKMKEAGFPDPKPNEYMISSHYKQEPVLLMVGNK